MEAFPESTFHGKIPMGCELCAKGAKMVLFINGICLSNCYYCPLSLKRKGQWQTWANERLVSSEKDVLEEARKMDALGTGITGGDPIMFADLTIKYATLLKNTFGNGHHIHLYTPGSLIDRNILGYLENVLDEIRFHPKEEDWKKIEMALAFDIDVGAEIPVIPGEGEKILRFCSYLEEIGAQFINLNELEYSDTNIEELRKRGFKFSKDSSAVIGSEELALDIVENTRDLDLTVHYCSSRFKDGVQLRERLKRRAVHVKKKYQDIDEDGLLVTGLIEAGTLAGRDNVIKTIIENFEDDKDMYEVEGTSIFTSWSAIEELRQMIDDPDLIFSIIKEYPTHNRILVDKEIL